MGRQVAADQRRGPGTAAVPPGSPRGGTCQAWVGREVEVIVRGEGEDRPRVQTPATIQAPSAAFLQVIIHPRGHGSWFSGEPEATACSRLRFPAKRISFTTTP